MRGNHRIRPCQIRQTGRVNNVKLQEIEACTHVSQRCGSDVDSYMYIREGGGERRSHPPIPLDLACGRPITCCVLLWVRSDLSLPRRIHGTYRDLFFSLLKGEHDISQLSHVARVRAGTSLSQGGCEINGRVVKMRFL